MGSSLVIATAEHKTALKAPMLNKRFWNLRVVICPVSDEAKCVSR